VSRQIEVTPEGKLVKTGTISHNCLSRPKMPNNIQFHVDFVSVPMQVHEQNMIFGLGKFLISMHFAMAGRSEFQSDPILYNTKQG
jgi:hypothetical protein